ncbi:MAG: hypothetical protein ABR989_16100 [Candidatus Binatus soli]|jgi:hypothetical protein
MKLVSSSARTSHGNVRWNPVGGGLLFRGHEPRHGAVRAKKRKAKK